MTSNGWTVAQTGAHPANSAKARHVKWSDRTQSQEDLDKLLAGLDKLTEALPDLGDTSQQVDSPTLHSPTRPVVNGGGVCESSSVSPAVHERTEQRSGTSKSSAEQRSGTDSAEVRKNYGAVPSSADEDCVPTPFPSVKATRQLLQSRDTYDSGDSSPLYTMGGVATSQPYHTRQDSKPFSYIRSNSLGRAPSRNLSRTSSREALSPATGLESPSLLRKIMGGGEAPPSPALSSPTFAARPQFTFETNNNTVPIKVNHESTPIRVTNGSASPAGNFESPVQNFDSPPMKNYESPMNSHDSMQTKSYDSKKSYDSMQTKSYDSMQTQSYDSPPSNHFDPADEEASMTWLQRQQEKLRQRREAQRRFLHKESPIMRELKTSLDRARSDTTDGYASDGAATTTLYSETTSRESSPHKTVYHVPLRVEGESFYGGHKHQSLSQQFQQQSVYSTPSTAPTAQPIYSSPAVPIRSNSATRVAEYQSSLSRQKSDTSYDRSRPFISRRLRNDSESESEHMSDYMFKGSLGAHRSNGFHASNTSLESTSFFGGSQPGSRPITPGFPSVPGTPYQSVPRSPAVRHHDLTRRAPSPAGSMYQAGDMSRRGSVSSEPADVSPLHVKLVKDNYKFWYKPNISREEAISVLKVRPPGTFVVRDSNSFPGAFGLALKVATPPPNTPLSPDSNELIRHFLIEPTSKGVKLKGYSNEPVFASLSALVYQHTITPLALPTKLVLPQSDLEASAQPTSNQMQQLLALGAACNVLYLFTMETDALTGPAALKKTVSQLLLTRPVPNAIQVHFKVSSQGITLTDNARKLFFRKHYNTPTITFCGTDPEDRRWKGGSSADGAANRLFGFVAKKPGSRSHNQCHVFAEQDPDQPARAIVNFVNKVMLSGNNGRSDVV